MAKISKHIAALPPEKLAILAQRVGKRGVGPRRARIAKAPRDGQPLPLSFAQQRLWFLDQFEPGNPFYNILASFRVRGPYDVAALTRSLNEIVRRHEALRTIFRSVDGQPMQVIASSLHLEVPVVDLSARDVPEREAEAARLASEEARLPFDLSRGPLLRAKLIRLAEAEHVLLLTMHHIVSDGWSIGVLYKELSALYGAYRAGRASPLSELPIQYADFALWQREQLQGEVLEEHLGYWKEHLRGAPVLLELPMDQLRPPVQAFHGALWLFRLPLELQEAVQALGRREGVTPFMTLLSAFGLLLSRYARQSDLVIGTPIANRTRAELEGLIGFFVNTLAMRIDLQGSPSFRELLLRVREVALGAYAHQDLPFERLVEELSPERNLSHSPIFQVAFALQNIPWEEEDKKQEGGDRASPDVPPPVNPGTAKFDLTLYMSESPQGFVGVFEYNTDLFDAGTIERMASHFEVLLSSAVAKPDQRITELPLMPDEERRQVLAEWNDTAAPYPEGQCMHELFEQQAERSPEAPAVLFQQQTLTYRELNTRANQLAHHLRGLGVGPEARVGLCLERSIETVVAILGVLKAGGAYVPLDPAYPKERLAFMMEDAAPSVLLTQTSLLGNLPPHEGATLVRLDRLGDVLSALPSHTPESGVTARNLAYIMYTSGSTGWPKGVLVEHRGLCNLPTVQAKLYGIKPGDRLVQFAPLCFDTSICEMTIALLSGATLVMGTADELVPGAPLVELLKRHAVTAMILAPSVLSALPAEQSAELPLRVLAMVGEACPADLVKRWKAPGRRLFNSYGPTETTIWASSAADLSDERIPPIGRPIANMQIYVLDEALAPVPIGVPGEIFIGGVGVARGYHRRPDLTAERFIPDPFEQAPGARLYRTGDRARWRPDGNLEFLGRSDEQVKIRGIRVELEEIRAALLQHPAVDQAVVVMREDTSGDRRLVAYVVGREGTRVPAPELRQSLSERLPRFMVPAAFLSLDALPLTPNGKVDRRALPEPEPSAGSEEHVAPRNALEEEIARIWADVLGAKQVDAHDNFFDLGGHSLLLARVHDRLSQRFDRPPSIVDLFTHTTVASLARFLGERASGEPLLREEDRDVAKRARRRREAWARRAKDTRDPS